jgi:YHS domain-containing protein
MFLIEITGPAGALDEPERAEIAGRICSDLLDAAGSAPAETMRRSRRMTHVLFHEAHGWTTGDGPLPPDAPPPFLVTITAPEAWREELSRTAIAVVRNALHAYDRKRGLSRAGGDVWINVLGVADGSIGLNGKPTTATGVVAYMTEEFRASEQAEPAEGLTEGVLIDPVCGMRVRLGPDAITLDRDGTTLGFCATGCRDVYLDNEQPAPADRA